MPKSLRHLILAMILSLLAGGFAWPTDTLAATDWAQMGGTWRGTGQIRENPLGASEKGVCKFDVLAQPDGHRLSFKGRCANSGQSAHVTTKLERDPQSGRILGASTASNIRGTIQLSGQETGNTVVLESTNTFQIHSHTYSLKVRLQMKAEKTSFKLVQTAIHKESGKPFTVIDMYFTRQD